LSDIQRQNGLVGQNNPMGELAPKMNHAKAQIFQLASKPVASLKDFTDVPHNFVLQSPPQYLILMHLLHLLDNS